MTQDKTDYALQCAYAFCRDNSIDTESQIKKQGSIYYDHFKTKQGWILGVTEMEFIQRLWTLFHEEEPPTIVKPIENEPWLQNNERRNQNPMRFRFYGELLIREGKGDLMRKIKSDTSVILDNCHNPCDDRQDRCYRSGLVYGHVQSGKTANYLGLINRAIDAGYKQVVVLTGISEELRKQTQKRIDRAVIGRDSSGSIGIGKINNFSSLNKIKSFTSVKSDLSKENIDVWKRNILINDIMIWVIKKNKSVLECFIRWLNYQINKTHSNYEKISFLIIDDEADNASIQSLSRSDFEELYPDTSRTSNNSYIEKDYKITEEIKSELIKTINKYIRVILSLIRKKTFVAYTATPYSIINQCELSPEYDVFIDGKEYKIDKNCELFPKDFITLLDPPSDYLGVDKFFPPKESKENLKYVTCIEHQFKKENLNSSFPIERNYYSFNTIPQSLKHAINYFITVIIIRKMRAKSSGNRINFYNTMLVHTSYLTYNVDYLAYKINEYLKELTTQITKRSSDVLQKIRLCQNIIGGRSENPVISEAISFNDISEVLNSCEIPLDVISFHSKTYREDYSRNRSGLLHTNRDLIYHDLDFNQRKQPRNYVVVGGNKLSRGLTLEGLSVSYFVRRSTRQDSMYQMGRWFGYRNGYEDCVQVFMSEKQIEQYQDIAKIEADLRSDLNKMNENKIEPTLWAIRITLPSMEKFAKIYVTDPNKLRHTQKRKISLAGTNFTLKYVKELETECKENIKSIEKLICKIDQDFPKNRLKPYNDIKSYYYVNVEPIVICEFLEQYHFYEGDIQEFNTLENFIRKNLEKIDSFSVAIKQPKNPSNRSKDFEFVRKQKLYTNQRGDFNRPGSNRIRKYKSVIDGVEKSTDRIFDLLLDEKVKIEYKKIKDEGSRKINNWAYDARIKSRKGLLLIIFSHSNQTSNDISVVPLIHLALPRIQRPEKTEYVIERIIHNS